MVLTTLIEKCLGSNRAGTKQNAADVLLELLDASETPSVIVDGLIEGTKAKQPKVVVSSVAMMKEMVRLYGARTVDVKPILKHLKVLFSHSDASVRGETSALSLEIFKWTGQVPFDGVFKDLKPVQVNELSDLFQQHSSSGQKPTQERFMRSQRQEDATVPKNDMSSSAESIEAGNNAVNEEQAIDALDFVDPVDVLSKVPKDLEERLGSSKWKDRKEVLDELEKVLEAPKFADGSYISLIAIVSKKIPDVNMAVSLAAISCIEKLAKGTRADQFRSLSLCPLLEKAKEKKQSFVTAIREALDAIFQTTMLKSIQEDVMSYFSNKNPNIRLESVLFLGRCMESKKTPVLQKSELKGIANELVKLLDDSVPEVREGAMQSTAILMKKVGEKALNPFLEKVDQIKLNRIKEFSGSSRSLEKENKPPSATGSLSSIGSKKPQASLSSSKPAASIKKATSASNVASNKPSGIKKKAAPSKEPLSKESKSVSAESLVPRFKYSDEQAVELFKEKFGEVVFENISNSNWKQRLETMDKILEEVGLSDVDAEMLVRTFVVKNVFKDSNFQVLLRLTQILTELAKKNLLSNQSLCTLIVPPLVEKFGDIKLRKPVYELFASLMEKNGTFNIMKQTIEGISDSKSPKILSETMKAMKDFLNEFGAAGIQDPLVLITKTKPHLENTNSVVRSAAVQLLGTYYLAFGKDCKQPILSCVEGNAQLQAVIEQEFEKADKMGKLDPVRKQEITVTEAPVTLFKPTDLSSSLESNNVFEKLENTNWKERKEALDNVQQLLEKSTKFAYNHSLAELFGLLCKRVNDSNKNLAMQALEVLSSLVSKTADKGAFERFQLKSVVTVVCANSLNDNKPQVREKGLSVISSVFEVTTSSIQVISSFLSASSGETSSAMIRKELLYFIQSKMDKISGSDALNILSNLVESCIDDKSIEVRKLANDLIPVILGKVSNIDDARKILAKKNLLNYLGEASQIDTKVSSPKPLKRSTTTLANSRHASKASSSSIENTKTSVAKSTLSLAPEPAEEFIMLSNPKDSKEKRAEANYGSQKWTLDSNNNTIRSELVDALKSQCEGSFSSGLIALMFSKSHHKEKDYLKALTLLEEIVSKESQKLVESADLVFKYLSVRYLDSNTSILLKCLDVTEKLVTTLVDVGYHMTEYEASVFFPSFLTRIGDQKDVVRQRVHSILKMCLSFYPSSKLLNYLFGSLANKNSRVRSECIDEISEVVQRNGLQCLNLKLIPSLGSQISDNATRQAAINCLSCIYQMMGETIWKHLTKLGDKEKSLLEEKLKRTKLNESVLENAPTASDGLQSLETKETPAVARNTDVQERPIDAKQASTFSLNFDQLDLPELSPMVVAEVSQSSLNLQDQAGGKRSASSEDMLLDYTLTQITSGDTVQSTAALKNLEKMLSNVTPYFLDQVNALVNAITLQIRLVYSPMGSVSSPSDNSIYLKLLKRLVNVLVLMCSDAKIASAFSRDTLNQMTTELITRLVDSESNNKITGNNEEATKNLNRAFNVLMIKVLENCPQNSVISVLLDLLDVGVSSLHRLTGADLEVRTKFTELVMKCLWKLTKALKLALGKKVSVLSLSLINV